MRYSPLSPDILRELFPPDKEYNDEFLISFYETVDNSDLDQV